MGRKLVVPAFEDIIAYARKMEGRPRTSPTYKSMGAKESIVAICLNATHMKRYGYSEKTLPEYGEGAVSPRKLDGAYLFRLKKGASSYLLISSTPIEEKAIEYQDIQI